MNKIIAYIVILTSTIILSVHYFTLKDIQAENLDINLDHSIDKIKLIEEAQDIQLAQNYFQGYNNSNTYSQLYKSFDESNINQITKYLDNNYPIQIREDRMKDVCDILTKLASYNMNNEFIKLLTEKQDNISWYQNLSSLHCAAEGGNLELIKYILQNDSYASVNKISQNGNLPIHYSASNNNIKLMEYLIQKGSQIKMSNSYGNSPLYIAIANGNLDIIKLLEQNNIDILDAEGYSQARLFTNDSYPNFEYFYVKHDKNSNYVNTPIRVFPTTPIHLATKFGHIEILAYLLDKGANINSTDYYNLRIIHYAVIANNYELVNYLLSKGANTNVQDKQGNTPLHLATDEHVDTRILEILINHNANPNIEDNSGATALNYAITEGSQEKTMLLQNAKEKFELLEQLNSNY